MENIERESRGERGKVKVGREDGVTWRENSGSAVFSAAAAAETCFNVQCCIIGSQGNGRIRIAG